jgi:hypothetical protein
MRAALALGAVLGLATCGSPTVSLVQQQHAREVHCDRRYVYVDHVEGEAWRSRGCGFEADWSCRAGECALRDLRAHGTGAP